MSVRFSPALATATMAESAELRAPQTCLSGKCLRSVGGVGIAGWSLIGTPTRSAARRAESAPAVNCVRLLRTD